jgi:hypothetical protein
MSLTMSSTRTIPWKLLAAVLAVWISSCARRPPAITPADQMQAWYRFYQIKEPGTVKPWFGEYESGSIVSLPVGDVVGPEAEQSACREHGCAQIIIQKQTGGADSCLRSRQSGDGAQVFKACYHGTLQRIHGGQLEVAEAVLRSIT